MTLGSRLFAIFFPAIFVVGGGALIALYMNHRAAAEESLSWPRVPAVIERAEVVQRDSQEGGSDFVVAYRYSIDGRDYHGSRVAFGTHSNSERRAREARYRRGLPVEVSVDPRDPANAVIEPGQRPGSFYLAIAGGLMIGLGIVIIRMIARG
jgi:hypothetical protein